MASSPKIDDLRKKFEENPRRYFAPLANEYRKAGDIEQAIAICREYLPQQPGHMSGHIVFGQALYEARQLEEAKTVFETALSLDPENLIALRHLGDISLMAGDTEAAKTWYKRVLEADPRNEETQAQLASLEAAGKPPAAPTPVVATPVKVESLSTAKTSPMPAAKPTASSAAPTVVMKAMGPPPRPGHPPNAPAKPVAPAAPVTPTSATVAMPTPVVASPPAPAAPPAPSAPAAGPVDLPKTLVMEAPHGMTPVAKSDQPVVTQALGLESTAIAGGADAPAMDSFSLEGLETTSLSAPPPPPPPQPATAEVPALDLDMPIAPPAAPAPVAAAPAPSIDLDFAAPAPAAPAVPAAPAAATADLPMLDIGDLTVPAAAPAPVAPPPIPEIALDLPPVAAAPAPAPVVETIDLGFASAPVVPAAPPPVMELEVPAATEPAASPFVTETMAELYLQQGHRDEALRVYRALLESKPGDAGLLAKVASLEAPPAPVEQAAGPTIREVLILIAQRRPGYRPEGGNGAVHHEEAPAYAAMPSDGSRPSDGIASFVNHAQPDPMEERAALMLAMAFADLNGMGNGGASGLDLSAAAAAAAATSARPAVAVPAPTTAPSNFSFDKFFSPRVTAEHAAQASPAAKSESKEDVAKFTQWLEGLKQQ